MQRFQNEEFGFVGRTGENLKAVKISKFVTELIEKNLDLLASLITKL